jgi:hypothetical protein
MMDEHNEFGNANLADLVRVKFYHARYSPMQLCYLRSSGQREHSSTCSKPDSSGTSHKC